MIRLRPFKLSDAKYILEWFEEEEGFVKWCAGKFQFPLTIEQLTQYYHELEIDEKGWIMVALNEEGIPVGHFVMRRADYENNSIHLGFIVVNSKMRGHGYGKEMLSSALTYIYEILKMKRVTLSVYDNNPVAHSCYKAVGFIDEKYLENSFLYKDKRWGLFDMAATKPNQ
ncbi:MAG: GNAT family N-acetyltransferase [Lachnotalea sp.]